MLTDKKIIKGCLKGNKKAQNKLYSQYASVLLGICIRYCKSKEDAEDILQESFIKIFSNIAQLKNEDTIFFWMRKIVINHAIRQSYNKRNYVNQILFNDTEEVNRLDISYSIDNSSCEELLLMIQELPDGYQTIFNLYAIDGYKHKEIAEMLNISESTSKSQYANAKKLLQLKIQKKIIFENELMELKIQSN
jgi:RNA polymerase sigma-70 factor (ECF subfamily)